ncbi:hypothetical protein V0U79_09470 [Hyphobacterium sp. HN65]|uniref:Uncharacterized protein n=1 Tax=Hyphobacterium lacteum TaxID=3116575 RepID=A0ABU7LRQ4_9PROT|nr:hypothetical protein [Hyphobacterium sp. HN65]MEE2526595.1 hypothetical protein [Hyphobacterium sp. HN65]
MILANLARAVREQNYYAVFIEFVIVIAGVVIGFQISGWQADRALARQEAQIVQRLIGDFRSLAESGDFQVEYHARNLRSMDAVLAALNAGEIAEDQETLFVDGLTFAYQHASALQASATFREIVSNGQLGLIDDEAVRAAVMGYHERLEDSDDTFLHIRLMQTLYVVAYNRHFRWDPSPHPTSDWRRVESFDFDTMLADPEFYDAAEELREFQRFYYAWHVGTRERAQQTLELLEAYAASHGIAS